MLKAYSSKAWLSFLPCEDESKEHKLGRPKGPGITGLPKMCRYVRDGLPVSSFPELRTVMEANGFQLKAQEEMPFVIREHARKFQWGCAHGSVWVKT